VSKNLCAKKTQEMGSQADSKDRRGGEEPITAVSDTLNNLNQISATNGTDPRERKKKGEKFSLTRN